MRRVYFLAKPLGKEGAAEPFLLTACVLTWFSAPTPVFPALERCHWFGFLLVDSMFPDLLAP